MRTMLLALLPVTALAGVDRVPEDFSTIQDAIDNGTEAEIHVAPGKWDGATVTRSVRIVGNNAVIAKGVRLPDSRARAGFILGEQADDSSIEGFNFACDLRGIDLGVYASTAKTGKADRITVAGNRFDECVQGVTNAGSPVRECQANGVDGGSSWVVENNTFDGFSTRTAKGGRGGGIGVLMFNAEYADVFGNRFTGRVADVSDFTTSGVSLAGCWDCTVSGNSFAVTGGTHYWSAIANLGYAQPGAAATERLILADNDASRDSAPHHGINFRSFDSFDGDFAANHGLTYVDHTVCGDNQLDSFAE